MSHCSLDLGEIEMWIRVGRKLDVAIALREPLDHDIGEVAIGDRFVDHSEPAADACSLHDLVARLALVRV